MAARAALPAKAADNGAQPEAHFDAMKRFVRYWSLDSDNTVDFMRLPPHQREEVLDTFNGESSSNVNVAFHQFVWTFLRGERDRDRDRGSERDATPKSPVRKPRRNDPASQLEMFAEQWSLDSKAMARLVELTPSLQEQVMKEFAPPPGCANASSLLMAFLKQKIARREQQEQREQREQQGEKFDPYRSFAQQWGLSDEAIQRLKDMPLDEQEEKMASFNPSANTRDVNSTFMKFLKIPVAGAGADRDRERDRGQGARERERDSAPQRGAGGFRSLEEFAEHYRLDSRAFQNIADLPPEIQDAVLNNFAPPPDSPNVSALLMSFVKSLRSRHRSAAGGGGGAQRESQDPVQAFAERYGFDSRAMDLLQELTPEQREHAVAEFRPPEGWKPGSHASALFMSWIKSLRTRQRQEEIREERGVEDAAVDEAMREFAERWGLDDFALDRLRELPPDLQDEVMADFNPSSASTNNSAIFMKYVKSKQGAGAPDAQDEFAPYVDFAEKWMLSEDAINRLRQLPKKVQEEVMATFNPPADTRDSTGKFISYMKMVKNRMMPACKFYADGFCKKGATCEFSHDGAGGADPVSEFGRHWGLDDQAVDRLRSLPPLQQADCMLTFNARRDSANMSSAFMSYVSKRYGTGAGGGGGRWADGWDDSNQANAAYREFQRTWGLNDESMSLLVSLPRDTQDDIMTNFNPKHSANEYNGIFMSFAKSRYAGPTAGSQKRWQEGGDRGAPPWKYQKY
eukprot:TRINITY_DN37208_c0_g1_i1.p1 TRINITY_DN37208_c0_g1~~TRINITY_DN37208_c0_g1_i1.p1  ORF type:complete len:741 (-),score=182.96 TRINITY_DN37208_c0_g1_i1:78-2300(-)